MAARHHFDGLLVGMEPVQQLQITLSGDAINRISPENLQLVCKNSATTTKRGCVGLCFVAGHLFVFLS